MAKATILLVEDEKDLAEVLRFNLKNEGFGFLLAKNAEAGLAMALKHKPDLIISDIMLPKMDGLEMIRTLRQNSQVPVIFLTAKRSEIDKVVGFKLGADDYLSKPFSMSELICRVNAILHRAVRQTGAPPASTCIGAIEINFGSHEVLVKGKRSHLSPREFDLLALLVKANGEVISRERLLELLWGIEKSMEISTRTVDQHVARLRRGLLSERGRVVTVSKLGYRIKID